MLNRDKQREASRSIFMSSMTGLANTGAAAVTFLMTPLVYGASVDWVAAFATQHYGEPWSDLVDFAWFCVSACLVFFTARASLSTLLVMGGLALASRML